MRQATKDVPATPMPIAERYLSQRAVKAAEIAFGRVKIRKRRKA